MKQVSFILVLAALAGIGVLGCSDNAAVKPESAYDPEADLSHFEATMTPETASVSPSPLVTVSAGEQSLTFWPYTGADFSGQPQDPVNLVFVGKASPLQIRAALLALDGNRPAPFPPIPPFTSRWQDAIGDAQSGYSADRNWTGGVIQLACGDYGPVRFHIRLFRMGNWTVANAHFEVLIPGTADHQVLSWELAEQLVMADFLRSGLLDPVAPIIPTDQINESPFRTIPAVIYNGLPEELKQLIGGPAGQVNSDVPIATDGRAVILNLLTGSPVEPGTFVQDFTLTYDQVIPKPFCQNGFDNYVYVQGPVHLRQTVNVHANGLYAFEFKAAGELSVLPINPMTQEPTGTALSALIRERHAGQQGPRLSWLSSLKLQALLPDSVLGSGRQFTGFMVGADGRHWYRQDTQCYQD
ncbi:hypothetical protein C3F09_02115 [candidate division GN15 bacterium]|uniref:Uncharacterized protein n=1 Tax=candidate division GN15 bacterium TaxID=2072418 RepID=A0A855X3U8_9BACT|nr:MAG: hypothetical protein C3F09_02115 [candidate division GN15 bacterium]